MNGDTGVYIGTQIYAFTPESLGWFAITVFLLHRFFKKEIWKEKNKIIFAIMFAFLLSFASLWGQEILYNVTFFDKPERMLRGIPVTVGMMIFFVPFISEVITFCDHVNGTISDKDFENNRINDNDKLETNKLKIGSLVYGLISFAIFFISYIPVFLLVWPINIFGDAIDALKYDYLMGNHTTHHTPIHWLILGWFYDLGVKMGGPEKGLQFFTILQMAVLSGALAFFSAFLYKRRVKKGIRITTFLVSLLNPVNAYFAVTAEKGTIGIGLALISMVLLAEILCDFRSAKESIISKSSVIKMIFFVLTASIASLFRNNMIYAFICGGIIIVLLYLIRVRKYLKNGWKSVLALLCMFILTFVMYKGEYKALVKWQDLKTTDQYRETFAYPIMCLSRISILHKDEMPEGMYDRIVTFIPEEAMANYTISCADGVKGYANENHLKNDKIGFLKLFIKGALMFPGDYLDQLGWLTYGYWNPLNSFILVTTTPVIRGQPDGFVEIAYSGIFDKYENGILNYIYFTDGKYNIPLFSWFYRPTIYTWVALFAFCYGIYKREIRKISLSLIPLLYLATIFLGPLCLFRYMHLNILLFGFTLYILLDPESKPKEQV